MPIDPLEYINRVTEGNDKKYPPMAVDIRKIIPGDAGEVATEAQIYGYEETDDIAERERAAQYSGYESDGLNFNKDMFQDDTIQGVIDFLSRMRLTPKVQAKLAELYMIAASKDTVLTWSNGYMLKQKMDRFKLQLLEFKNTLIGPDSDSLLFGDYDLVMETFIARLETRISRSYEGFERRAGVSQISITQDLGGPQMQHEEKSGLSRLGRLNTFRGP